MPAVPILVTTHWEEKPPEVSERAWRESMSAGHLEMGDRWVTSMLPSHFDREARALYGYAPRTKGYLARKTNVWRKGKAAPPFIDLVFTGEMKRLMQSAVTVRGFPTRATIMMAAPKYVTFRPRGNQPDKHAEVTRVTPGQAQELSEFLARTVEERFAAIKDPKTEEY